MNAPVNWESAFAPSNRSVGADEAASPAPEIRIGIAVAVLFFVIFLGWAAVAPLDAAAQAPGTLVVSGQRQTVQHREGGVVAEVLVREGARVRRGQLLIRLSGADVHAQERMLTLQAVAMLAQRARLRAEQIGRSTIDAPVEFANLRSEYQAAMTESLRIQQLQLTTRMAVLGAQGGVIGQRTRQASSQARGYGSQLTGLNEQLRLLDEEIAGVRPMAERGFVSKNRLRALERSRAELEGQRGQSAATIAQAQGQIGETQLQVLETLSNHQDRVASELREVEMSLNEVMPKLLAAQDQAKRAEIRAPASGTVIGLSVFTPGGVVAAGQRLLDIVPDQAPLTIEAKFALADGDDLRVGQPAIVVFETLTSMMRPSLDGRISRVSADAFTDDSSGISYYVAEVSLPPSEYRKVTGNGRDALRAGLPVSVQVPLRRRTALQYALEPINGAFSRSFKEH